MPEQNKPRWNDMKVAWVTRDAASEEVLAALREVLMEPQDSRTALVLDLGKDQPHEDGSEPIGVVFEVGDSNDRQVWNNVVRRVRRRSAEAASLLRDIDKAGYHYVRIGD